ncbi:hypothetical protein M569_00582, partial [Genlisea aurea]
MGWRYKAGLMFIAAVVIIWVTSAEVTQDIFTAYKQPFAITYLGVSLMVVYLPISFIKDWIYVCLSRRKGRNADNQDDSRHGLESPLNYTGRKSSAFEIEIYGPMTRKDSEANISEEEGQLLPSSKRVDNGRVERKITSKDIAAYGFYIAPLWFMTEYLSNAALAHTSVASTTILSSTSGLFTLFIGAFLGQDSLSVAKIVAVFVSMAGVAMTTLGKTWADDDDSQPYASSSERSLDGDLYGVLSAVTYGLFTVLLKKFSGDDGEKVDVQKLFGYIGLSTLVSLWWVVWPLTALGIEPKFRVPNNPKLDEVVLANGVIGSVLSDYL